MRSASRIVIVALLGLSLALPVLPAASAAAAPADRLVVQPSTPNTPSSPGATAPSGPKITPDTQAEKDESQRKLVMGVSSVVLIGIVIWGRSVRSKRRKKQQGAGSGS